MKVVMLSYRRVYFSIDSSSLFDCKNRAKYFLEDIYNRNTNDSLSLMSLNPILPSFSNPLMKEKKMLNVIYIQHHVLHTESTACQWNNMTVYIIGRLVCRHPWRIITWLIKGWSLHFRNGNYARTCSAHFLNEYAYAVPFITSDRYFGDISTHLLHLLWLLHLLYLLQLFRTCYTYCICLKHITLIATV